MKNSPVQRRLSAQDLTVVLAVTIISLLALSFVFSAPLLPTLVIIGTACAALFIYAALPETPSETLINNAAHLRSDEDYMEAQANLADKIADAVIMIDNRQRVIYANGPARALHDINVLGRPLSTYVREPGVKDIIEQALGGQTPEPMTYHVEDPAERFIRLTASPFTWRRLDDEQTMAVLFFYDMTDYMLADSQRADFLANASHELKTPVASLLGYIETLRGHAKDDPEAQDMFLGIMQSQAERMQRLIEDLLSLRRIELIEHMAPSETADLYLAAKAAMEAVEPLAQKRRIKVKLASDKECLVTGDQDELIQLVLNLLDNAVKISAEGTLIEISIQELNQWLPGQAFSGTDFSSEAATRRIVSPANPSQAFYELKLRDKGPGFSREHLPRIGERFYRIAGDLSSQEKGTGLGLAIVKHITRRHRGGLLIQSSPGEGTEFTVLIPSSETDI